MRKEEDEERVYLEEIRRTVGRNVARLRVSKQMTQRQLSDFAGISNANLGMIEAGLGNSSLGILGKLARALSVPMSSLLEGAGVEAPSGIEGMLGKMMTDLDRANRHLEVRRDEIGRVMEDIQIFFEGARETLKGEVEEARRRLTEKK